MAVASQETGKILKTSNVFSDEEWYSDRDSRFRIKKSRKTM